MTDDKGSVNENAWRGEDADVDREADRNVDRDADRDVDRDVARDVELAIVTMRFDAADDEALLAVLSKYIVLTRMEDGARNVDLVSSVTQPGRHLIIEKWETPDHQRAHFDSTIMVEMATACTGILSAPPEIDLWEGTSAHDLA